MTDAHPVLILKLQYYILITLMSGVPVVWNWQVHVCVYVKFVAGFMHAQWRSYCHVNGLSQTMKNCVFIIISNAYCENDYVPCSAFQTLFYRFYISKCVSPLLFLIIRWNILPMNFVHFRRIQVQLINVGRHNCGIQEGRRVEQLVRVAAHVQICEMVYV